MPFPEHIRKRIEEAVRQGKLVVIHPQASRKVGKSPRVEPIDYPSRGGEK